MGGREWMQYFLPRLIPPQSLLKNNSGAKMSAIRLYIIIRNMEMYYIACMHILS